MSELLVTPVIAPSSMSVSSPKQSLPPPPSPLLKSLLLPRALPTAPLSFPHPPTNETDI